MEPKQTFQQAGRSQDPPKLLTIGGSDSGGAAGIQADLKTFTALQVYGMSVLTAVTAQNSVAVRAVHPLPAEFVASQLDAVLSDYGAAAIKTGFIGRPDLIETIAANLREYSQADGRSFLLVDPVLVNHRGHSMFGSDVVAAYRDQLFPLADLITPNRQEAALLAGRPLPPLHRRDELAAVLQTAGAQRILLTGVPNGAEVVDVLLDNGGIDYFSQPAIVTENRHGSGDTLSAAICAFVAKGNGLIPAVRQAQQFTHKAMRRSAAWKLGAGHGPLAHW
jgi:hydroxymethylpyrimidine/phosphomethylpyrimidine kinase